MKWFLLSHKEIPACDITNLSSSSHGINQLWETAKKGKSLCPSVHSIHLPFLFFFHSFILYSVTQLFFHSLSFFVSPQMNHLNFLTQTDGILFIHSYLSIHLFIINLLLVHSWIIFILMVISDRIPLSTHCSFYYICATR